MQEPVKKNKTSKENTKRQGRAMDSSNVEEQGINTDKIQAISGTSTLDFWNFLIKNNLCTFNVLLNGAGYREVVEFLPVTNRYFINVIYKDKLIGKNYETTVAHFTNFIVFMNSEKWYYDYT